MTGRVEVGHTGPSSLRSPHVPGRRRRPGASRPIEQTACFEKISALRDSIRTVFVGKDKTVDLVIVCLLSGGHLLLEDVPGVGKTTLAKALARSLDGSFKRIQFTPDLLPSDITGVSIYSQQNGNFVFKPGPIFANVILADEINRTNPRTQSSLLEAMNDFQVSVDGITNQLERPFIVLATQNPFEYEGTYPLPESQLDRFLMRLHIGYPAREAEKEVLRSQRKSHPLDALEPVVTAAEVVALQDAVKDVRVDELILDYIIDLTGRTRDHPQIAAGVSPRGSLALRRAAQAIALVAERDYVVPDDVKSLAVPVMAHRVILRSSHGPGSSAANDVVREILDAVAVPV